MPCCGTLCGWRKTGPLCLRPHHGHAALRELYAAQTFLVLLECQGYDTPGGEFSGAGPSRTLVGWRSVGGSGCVSPVTIWYFGKVTAQPASL